MKTAKFLLPAIVLFFAPSFAKSEPKTTFDALVITAEQASSAPDAVVKDLYSVHGKDNDKILNGKSRALLDKYFDKNLANLIWKDLTTHRDEVGVLDFDPFYNAQDMSIKKLKVAPAKIQNNKASVTVTFENFGTKETIVYALVKQSSAWKISDIKYKDGGSLLKYFKENSDSAVRQTKKKA